MRKCFLAIILLASPVFAAQKYDFKDPKLDDEMANNYKEHKFPNFVYAQGTNIKVSTITAYNGLFSSVTLTSWTSVSTVTIANVNFDLTNSTVTMSSGTLPSFMVVGTITGDNASLGRLGELLSVATARVNFPSTGNYGDLVSMSVSAGNFLCSVCVFATANGATVTNFSVGLSSSSGTSANGLVEGDNYGEYAVPTSGFNNSVCIASYPVNQNTANTWYLKYRANFSVATPKAAGRMSCIRIR